jgi:hypothetical protein
MSSVLTSLPKIVNICGAEEARNHHHSVLDTTPNTLHVVASNGKFDGSPVLGRVKPEPQTTLEQDSLNTNLIRILSTKPQTITRSIKLHNKQRLADPVFKAEASDRGTSREARIRTKHQSALSTVERARIHRIEKVIEETKSSPQKIFRGSRTLKPLQIPSYLERTLMRAQMVKTTGSQTVIAQSPLITMNSTISTPYSDNQKARVVEKKSTARSCINEVHNRIRTKRDIRLKDPLPHVLHTQ